MVTKRKKKVIALLNWKYFTFFPSFKTSPCFFCPPPAEKLQGVEFLIQECIITLYYLPVVSGKMQSQLQSLAVVFVSACFEMVVAILYDQAYKLYSAKCGSTYFPLPFFFLWLQELWVPGFWAFFFLHFECPLYFLSNNKTIYVLWNYLCFMFSPLYHLSS